MRILCFIMMMVIMATAIGGCQTATPTRVGAAQGAVAGSILGAVVGHNNGRQAAEGAAIGAVTGGLIGALIGDAQDEVMGRRNQTYYSPPPPPPAPSYQPSGGRWVDREVEVYIPSESYRVPQRIWVPE